MPKPSLSTADPPERTLTVAHIADRLDVSARTVRRLIADGELRVLRIGRAVRITESEYRRYLKKVSQ